MNKDQILKECIREIVQEYLDNDPEVKTWALFTTKIYDPIFKDIKDRGKLKKTYKQLMRSPKVDVRHKKAIYYFYNYQLKKLGSSDYDKKLVKFPVKK